MSYNTHETRGEREREREREISSLTNVLGTYRKRGKVGACWIALEEGRGLEAMGPLVARGTSSWAMRRVILLYIRIVLFEIVLFEVTRECITNYSCLAFGSTSDWILRDHCVSTGETKKDLGDPHNILLC